jgi:dephospho-CoA kinase
MTQHNKVPVIGLTGGIGSGKTVVSNHLARLGATIIDADEIAHQLTRPQGAAMPAIVQAFGPEAAQADGAMNRNYIRQRVFEDPKQRQVLENILHPIIEHSMRQALDTPIPHYAVLVIPLLFETQRWIPLLDAIVVVDCPTETQEQRVLTRNRWPLEQVRAVMSTQATRETRSAGADFILNNNQDTAFLIQQIEQLDQNIRKIMPK